MKIQNNPSAAVLRSKAQELKDAAGGEKIAAQQSKKLVDVHTDSYQKALAARTELLNEAKKLRNEAAGKLQESVGGRGLHALANVAKAIGTLINVFSGGRVSTTISLKSDPTATKAAEELQQKATALEGKAGEQYALALAAHKEAAAALGQMQGHEVAAANHTALADQLLAAAREKDKPPVINKIRADDPISAAPQPQFEPGKVSFGDGEPRKPLKLSAPNIEAPPKGEKKASESLVATRWAAEAAGIDWTKFSSTGDLKKAVASAEHGLHTKNGASPFEVKKRICERLGLPTKSEAVHALDLGAVRELFAKREAIGMPRLAPRAEFEGALANAGFAKDARLDELAMYGTSTASFALKDAATALKAAMSTATYQDHAYVVAGKSGDEVTLQNPWAKANDKPITVKQSAVTFGGAAEKKAFDEAAAKLDASKRVMLDVIEATPPAQGRHVLALDTVDAMEVGHGKPGATTKLGFALESLTKNEKFAKGLKTALGLDDAAFGKAVDAALRASEWTTLGEMKAPASVLAFPGPLSGEQRSMIGKLPAEGSKLAKELGLLDGDALKALEEHLTYKGHESASAQILGVTRMLTSLAGRRDFRTKELLQADEIHEELMKNARAPSPTVDAKLVSLLQPALGGAIAELRK